MPLDDYASAVGGGLKLKGAKVTKPKKKKRRDKTDLEKNLETGDEGSSTALVKHREESAGDSKSKSKKKSEDPEEDRNDDDDDEGSGRVVQKTEAERRYEERKRKRVCSPVYSPGAGCSVAIFRSLF